MVSSTNPGPKKLMLDGKWEDLKAVFDALPTGSSWQVIYGKYDFDQKHFNKESEEDWGRLKQYMHETGTMEAMNEILALCPASRSMRFKFAMEMAIKTIVALQLVFLMTMEMQIYTGWPKFAIERAMATTIVLHLVFLMIITVQRYIL